MHVSFASSLLNHVATKIYIYIKIGTFAKHLIFMMRKLFKHHHDGLLSVLLLSVKHLLTKMVRRCFDEGFAE